MEERNTAQWASFGHVGVWYAERAAQRIVDLTVPTVFLQRWWRQRFLPRRRQILYPIVLKNNAYDVASRINKLRGADSALSKPVGAYEKLDGTNLGVRCDGAVFGRRYRVHGDLYQRVVLKGAIPTISDIQVVKNSIVGAIAAEFDMLSPMLVLYGELMCNGKFGYDKRGMVGNFYCFGAVLDPFEGKEQSDAFANELLRQGFYVTVAPESGMIRMRMNVKLATLVQAVGIRCAPLIDQGPLRELCFRLKETLLDDKREGVVLTGGDGCLFKWKTSLEDESKGYDLLTSLLDLHSVVTLELSGVDVAFIQLLIAVAGKKPAVTRIKNKRKKNKKTEAIQAYDEAILKTALASAMSKYDAPEAYFERGERATILANLNKELVEDLEASTAEEIKCCERAVGQKVGRAFGKWKQAQKSEK